uniref:Uncharacterized protein n=1 Tax=Tanacetum cinerariifolium TaxID=118510 RepID=A0A6L2K0P7_TANCI|nr:hypothetical protein [Tanacetum cinerariifolium]
MCQDRHMQMVGVMVGISLDSLLCRMQEIRLGTMQGKWQGIRIGLIRYRIREIRLFKMQLRIWVFRMLGIRIFFVPRIANQILKQNRIGDVVEARAEGNVNGNNGDIDEIEEVNANCILMANLQQASTSGTQTDKALVYDSDGSDEVHHYENCYDNEIFNMFTQEEQYTELLVTFIETHQIQ